MTMRQYVPSANVVKLFIFVGIVWAALVGPGSMVLILNNMGATNAQMGIVTAIAAVMRMVFQPMWGMVSDKVRSPRRVITYCLMASGVFFGSVFFTGSFHVAVVLLLIDVAFQCGVVGLLDSHTLAEVNIIPGLQYGHIRLAGSVFFGGLSFIYSVVIGNFGVMAIIPIAFGVTVSAVLWGLFAAKGKSEGAEIKRVRPNLRKDTFSLITNMRYLILVAFTAISALALQPLWMFLITFVENAGGTAHYVPLIHAIRCVVEVPLFILAGAKLKNASPKKLMAAGVFFHIIYIGGLFFATSFNGILLAHIVGGTPGFIFGLTGRLKYLNNITPETVRSTSITLMGTVEVGLGAILGNLIAGMVLDTRGTQALAGFSLVAIAVAVATLAVLIIYTKGDKAHESN